MARGSSSTVVFRFGDLPLLADAERLSKAGVVTGASKRNWLSYADAIELPAGTEDWQRNLLTDPQTSGGLLVACTGGRADSILRQIRDAGYPAARIVGQVEAGAAGVRVDL
jgi:selenide,water dikinase